MKTNPDKEEKAKKRQRKIQIFMMCASAFILFGHVLGFLMGTYGLSKLLIAPLWCLIFKNYYDEYKNTDEEDVST